MNKNIVSLLLVLSSLSVGCAGLGGATARETGLRRGAVVTHQQEVKAFVAGPAVVRAYAGSAGGAIYVVPVVSGGDRDCSRIASDATPVVAERTATLTVQEGEIACLSTATTRSYELLWRARLGDHGSSPAFASSAR